MLSWNYVRSLLYFHCFYLKKGSTLVGSVFEHPVFAMLKELVTLDTNAYVNDFFSSSLKNVCLFLSDVFVAAAQMEYFCTKDKKVASNIFELGFKKYKDKVGFVSQYLDFLIHLNGNYELKQNFVKIYFF